jgi:purine-binding chemotaxis protein CheW
MNKHRSKVATDHSRDETLRILEERARLLARLPEEKAARGEVLELAAFHLGNEYLGVPTSLVQETQPLRAHNWSRVPCAPAFIIGAVNLRGHIFSIMDLACFEGLPPHPLSEKAHILLVRGGRCPDGKEMELTLLADDVPQVRRVPLAGLTPPPGAASTREYVRGVTPDMLVVLDLERLLSDPRLIVFQEDKS